MGVPPEEAISKNLFQPPTAMQEDPDLPPDEWAEAYVDGRQFSSTEAVLKGALAAFHAQHFVGR
jgi:hypothetical protein